MKIVVSPKVAGYDSIAPRMDDRRRWPHRPNEEYKAQEHPSPSNSYTPSGDSKTPMVNKGFGTEGRGTSVWLGSDNPRNDTYDKGQPELTSHQGPGPADDNEGDLATNDFQSMTDANWREELGWGATLNSRDRSQQVEQQVQHLLRGKRVQFPRVYNADGAAELVRNQLQRAAMLHEQGD